MLWVIEIFNKNKLHDIESINLIQQARDLGVKIKSAEVRTIFLLESNELDERKINGCAKNLLIDKITQNFRVINSSKSSYSSDKIIMVFRKAGVMDPVEDSLKKIFLDNGIKVSAAKTGKKILLYGDLSTKNMEKIATKIIANPVIDEILFEEKYPETLLSGMSYQFRLVKVPILKTCDKELTKLSDEWCLSLNLKEMKAIKEYFKRKGRDATDIEIETIAQTWSEHCKHKTLTADFEFDGAVIRNLLGSTIFRVTKELNLPWCLSVFKDNAGVIEFDDEYAICFKVETHNHPSALDPYGGSNTGVGGVIRDILGCGLSAKPIFNTDIFCVGEPSLKDEEIPRGVFHSKRLLKGLVAGVRDYGNRMGIPTINGAVVFDNRYLTNPLVYCGTGGIMKKKNVLKEASTGDFIILIGGKTGRDGIHGATFSSVKLSDESEKTSAEAVQIGNAITEKKVLDAVLKASEEMLFTAITDCGAGGLSSAVGEMGKNLGAVVELSSVPLKYEGLDYKEIWISEAQERMVLAVPPKNLNRFTEIMNSEGVEITNLGNFTNSKKLEIFYDGNKVCELDMDFLHNGLPKVYKKAVWKKKSHKEPRIKEQKDYGDVLKKLLALPDIASKERIIRQYDHEVQGMSVIKSMQGIENDGPGDASVLKPLPHSWRGIAVGNGICPRYSDVDSYWMAASVIDEAIRNVIAVGADPNRIALLDNFCWGSVNDVDNLGALVRCCQGCYDIAIKYKTPFISGKDSLNNEFKYGKKTFSIPHTLLISAIGIIPDARKCITVDFKRAGSVIYIIGETRKELGGSRFYQLHKSVGNTVPKVYPEENKKIFEGLHKCIEKDLIKSCHDISEGGLAVAISEMCFAGGIGATIFLDKVICSKEVNYNYEVLFSESNGRFIIEVNKKDTRKVEKILCGVKLSKIGETKDTKRVEIFSREGRQIICEDINSLKSIWQEALSWL